MGKAKKIKITRPPSKIPLGEEIENIKFTQPKNRNKVKSRKDVDEEFVDARSSQRILSAARGQQRELEKEVLESKPVRFNVNISDEDESDLEVDQPHCQDDFYENIEITEEDEKTIEKFMSKNPTQTRNLVDIIMEKITEKQTELETQFSDAGSLQLQNIDPRIKQLYAEVGEVLKKYRSGRIPKSFKMIPALKNWEQILYLTDPPSWSAAAMYQATRIFASNLTEKMAQRFYSLVLLPRIRDDLAEYKRLNFHLYQALRKSLYKPRAFVKGLLLPLLESGNCTLREAIIVGSVIAKNSMVILHACAAISYIADMDYTGANSVMLRIFFDKKYALPYKVVDAVVAHFLRFTMDERELPVLWHQALLTFIQRYKDNISEDQRDLLLGLVRKHKHYEITLEIQRELNNAKCRDLTSEETTSMVVE